MIESVSAMNVCFLLQDTGALFGAERATLDLLRGLAATGAVTPTLLLIEETRLKITENRLRRELEKTGLEWSAVKINAPFSLRTVRDIRDALRARSNPILHTVGYKATVLGGWATGWGRSGPAVSTVHGWLFRPDFKERFYGWLEVLALKRFDRVICLSRFYQQMLKSVGLPDERLVRIPSGLDPRELPSLDRAARIWMEKRPFTVGIMGRLSSEKNHRMVLEAARLVKDGGADVRYLIAGYGPEERAIDRLIAKLDLAGVVERRPFMDRDEFLERVHALALCSTMENLPYSVLEAMGWARPIVATAVGGLPDLVENGRTGYLVSLHDAGQLAECIRRLAGHPEWARQLGAAGRQRVEQDFNMEAMVNAHLALYQQVTAT
jgi:glycosyltransferase involved in cell wall biosynthesis